MDFSVNIMFANKYWPMLTVISVAVILLLVVRSGWNKGMAMAQSAVVAANAKQLEKSVNYFYNDQDRFPTADEFSDQNIFGQYVKGFPLPVFVSKSCPTTVIYKRPSPRQYQIQFCLSTTANGYPSGWNLLSGNK